MEITISKSSLLNLVKQAGKIIASKNTIPILDNIQLELKEGELYVIAADNAGSLQFSTNEAIVLNEDDNVTTVDYKLLLNSLSALPEQPLNIFTANNKMIMKYVGGKFEFPYIQERIKEILSADDEKSFSIPAKDVAKGIDVTSICCATDEFRPVMGGIFLDKEKSRYVATDSHTLSVYSSKSIFAPGKGIIIPQKFCKSILPALQAAQEQSVAITTKGNDVIFSLDRFVATYRMIEGNYPRYESVIPNEFNSISNINRADFLSLLKRIQVFSKDNKSARFTIEGNYLKVDAAYAETNEAAEETMSIDADGKDIVIGFNVEKLITILSNINNEYICFKLIDSSHAGVITAGDDILYLVMPMILN